MKKVFVWLKNNILRHKKRLIYGALALFIGQICFLNLGGLGVNNSVYAETPDTPTQNADFQKKATGRLDLLSFLKKGCYVLLYPILILAGVLVNNSMVYAEVFYFDTVLWQLWNIMRNLANYALGFLFVYKIFSFLTTGQKSSDMSSLLKSTLIAGIGIQASRFLLAVLIDVSNILTYSVGGLPIHVLGTQSGSGDTANFGNPYVYQTVISTDFNDPDTVHFYLSNTSTGDNQKGDKFIAECETFYFKDGNESLIVGPKIIYYYDGVNYYPTESSLCHVGDDVYRLNGFAKGIAWTSCSGSGCKDAQNTYKGMLNDAIKELQQKNKAGIVRDNIQPGTVLQIKNAHLTGNDIRYPYNGKTPGLDVDNEVVGKEWNMARMHDILEGDDGYIGVFSALYSSLLNAGVQLTNSDSVYASLLNTILSFCHTLAVGIPLVAMVVVFFMRIGVIWMAIILSPVIILLKAFKLDEKLSKEVDIFKYLSVENLIGIIFSPAIICFAVSISTVLVRIISTVNAQDVMKNEQSILGGLVRIDLAGMSVGLGKLICSVIGVAISWFLIWSAIKSSELGKSELISGKNGLKGLAESALGSVPVVPIPTKGGGVDFVGASTVFGGNGQQGIISKLSSNLKEKYEGENNKAVEALFKSEDPAELKAKQVSAYKSGLTNLTIPQIGKDWLNQEIMIGEDEKNRIPITFTSLENADKEKVIESINSLANEDQRKAFGRVSTITVGTKVYEFDVSDNKYKVNSSSSPTTSPSA